MSVSVNGSSTGNMTISAPGGYTETFAFSDQATKNFILPSTMTAGTYFVNVRLTTQTINQVQGELITVAHPFDVAGIQVKVLDCQNDKGKYASSDTITTSFTISSNATMPAILKAWIVDPKGQYNSVGEQSTNLSSSENLLITHHSSLITAVAGIHRLVYGIYTSGDLLLASGSEAFDVGDAVLLGITTDKRDYPTNTEPVIVTGSLWGSVDANFDLGLDGDVVKSESISINGFMTYTTQLQNITPGPHTLKATLTAGGLKSTKEINFTYALSFMPKPQISASPAYLDFGSINLGTTSAQNMIISSTGNADLVIGTIALSGTTQGDFGIQNDNCSSRTISPPGTCTLGILFSPTSLGAKSASLSIPSNAHDMPTLNLPLAGTGTTTLNISINPSGSGRVAGTGIDCPGDCTENFSTSGTSIQLSATPADGYQFVNWTGDNNTQDNPVTISMDTNKNITANFIINVYTISATAGSGGTILPSGAITVNYGGSQTFSIMPNEGYHVVDVKVDGVSVGAVTNYPFSHITSSHTIEASFAINQYTLTGIAGPNGTISPSGAVTVNYGGSQTFTITPNAGNRISDVKVDGGSVGTVSSYIFSNVTSDHTIEVSFAINQYTITATAEANGTLSPSGSVAVDYGGSQTFNITPNEGYYVADVLVDGKSVGPVITYTFTNTTANHTIEASFASEIYTLDLPRTGQVTKYAQGDDGCIRAGILWPSPRFTDSADTTVTDHLAGLVWAANAGTPTIGSCLGGAKTWQGALDYVTCLNTKHYLGHNDWRLPNLNELESLIHAGQSDSSAWLRFQGFTNVKMDVYWSSTTFVYSSNEAWVVCFHQGEVTYDLKNSKAYVWPMRGMTSGPALLWRTGQTVSYAIGDDGDLMEGAALPVPRFTTNADTTLTDRLTGLVWLPSAGTPTIGSCVGGAKPWQGALDYIACFNTNNHLGHNDWRLPNRKELRSLAHYGEENTATWLNAQGFSNAEPAEYWSSTTSAACPDTAWSIDLVSGEMAGSRKNASGFVLSVRSGAIIPNTAPHLAPTGGGIYEFSTPVILEGKVSDFDGDLLTYEWLEAGRVLFRGQIGTISGGSPVNLPEQIFYLSLGTHVITLWVSDGVNLPVTSDVSVQIIDTTPPVLAPVSDRTILWPPNHQMVNVTILVHATDNTHCPVRLEAVVTSNEPQVGLGDGDIGPDWTEPTIDQVKGMIRLQLRSERSGGGKGRIYTITITGTDTSGNKSQAKVEITVPHDKGKK